MKIWALIFGMFFIPVAGCSEITPEGGIKFSQDLSSLAGARLVHHLVSGDLRETSMTMLTAVRGNCMNGSCRVNRSASRPMNSFTSNGFRPVVIEIAEVADAVDDESYSVEVIEQESADVDEVADEPEVSKKSTATILLAGNGSAGGYGSNYSTYSNNCSGCANCSSSYSSPETVTTYRTETTSYGSAGGYSGNYSSSENYGSAGGYSSSESYGGGLFGRCRARRAARVSARASARYSAYHH